MTREQFIALVSEEQESLRRFLLALCEGDRMEAEDIAQEAMVKAYIAMERFVERAKFATWLFKIAYNTFLDHQRSGWNRRTDLDAAEQMPGGPGADDAFQYQELAAEGEERHPAVLRQRLLREGDCENHGRFPIGCETAAFERES